MQVPFSPERAGRLGLVPARVLNLYPEQTPGGPTAYALRGRPGLSLAYTIGEGPIRGLFQLDGVQNGSKFAVSGSAFYKDATLVDYVTGSGRVRFAASREQLVFVSGEAAWCYDGTLNQITDIDLPSVSDVVYLAGRFYYQQADSDQWWFSALNDATSIDGLAFETAESAPDATVGVCVVGDEAVFFGSQTVEWFSQTGDASAPLVRASGRTYDKGCSAQYSIVPMDNSVLWVSNENTVCRAGSGPEIVSSPVVNEALRRCTRIAQCSAFPALWDGKLCYVLSIPGQGVHVLDIQANKWLEWSSYGRDVFRGWCAVNVGGTTYVGDDTTGQVWTLDPDALDDGGEPIERVASVFVPLSEPTRCDSVELVAVKGVGNPDAVDPQAELRWSDDGGRTFGPWKTASLGQEGQYGKRTIWRGCGLMRAPGRLFEVRCSDPVNVAFCALKINEPTR